MGLPGRVWGSQAGLQGRSVLPAQPDAEALTQPRAGCAWRRQLLNPSGDGTKILSWLCLSLSQRCSSLIWALPLQRTLWTCCLSHGASTFRGSQRFWGCLTEQSHCPELLPPFLVFMIPVPVSGLLQADAKETFQTPVIPTRWMFIRHNPCDMSTE